MYLSHKGSSRFLTIWTFKSRAGKNPTWASLMPRITELKFKEPSKKIKGRIRKTRIIRILVLFLRKKLFIYNELRIIQTSHQLNYK